MGHSVSRKCQRPESPEAGPRGGAPLPVLGVGSLGQQAEQRTPVGEQQLWEGLAGEEGRRRERRREARGERKGERRREGRGRGRKREEEGVEGRNRGGAGEGRTRGGKERAGKRREEKGRKGEGRGEEKSRGEDEEGRGEEGEVWGRADGAGDGEGRG